jgi:hypothetical protein
MRFMQNQKLYDLLNQGDNIQKSLKIPLGQLRVSFKKFNLTYFIKYDIIFIFIDK